MGLFTVEIEVAHPSHRRYTPVSAIVDTGATFSMFPRSFLKSLGIEPIANAELTTADGKTLLSPISEARFRIGEQERTAMVAFGSADDIYLLGAHTLQSFGLIADTTQHRLVPAKLLMVGIRQGMTKGTPAN